MRPAPRRPPGSRDARPGFGSFHEEEGDGSGSLVLLGAGVLVFLVYLTTRTLQSLLHELWRIFGFIGGYTGYGII